MNNIERRTLTSNPPIHQVKETRNYLGFNGVKVTISTDWIDEEFNEIWWTNFERQIGIDPNVRFVDSKEIK